VNDVELAAILREYGIDRVGIVSRPSIDTAQEESRCTAARVHFEVLEVRRGKHTLVRFGMAPEKDCWTRGLRMQFFRALHSEVALQCVSTNAWRTRAFAERVRAMNSSGGRRSEAAKRHALQFFFVSS